jgi:dienelactone hydrolase
MSLRIAVAGLVGTSLLAACATLPPAGRIDSRAGAMGLERSVVQGVGFSHVVYSRLLASGDAPLHIYLEGDGLPWATPTRASADPTPRRPYALELMDLDPAPSAYVGRPCYHGLHDAAGCDAALWTSDRYGDAVLASMARAIHSFAPPGRELVLVGFSGGGALAMLLAAELDSVVAVVTVAANLDLAAWAQHHDYTPLAGSADPALAPPLPSSIRQLHLAGGDDSVVPPRIVRAGLRRQDVDASVYAGFDHTCCWLEVWPEVLRSISTPQPQPSASLRRPTRAHPL